MTLSYFTGEQHSENFEKIIHLAEHLGYSVYVYESKDATQFDFLRAVFRDTAVVVDATIPNDLSKSTVYPILTAHVNCIDHILVISDSLYNDGTRILPMNITPQRVIPLECADIIEWMKSQLEDLKENRHYERFDIGSIDTFSDNFDELKENMEDVLSTSIEMHQLKQNDKILVMISYRNSCGKEVELFKKRIENSNNVKVTMIPPGTLCDDHEALSPLRRWMLVGLLEEHIRNVNEVWVYYNDIYTNSWWTIAEIVMVAYVNHNRPEREKIKIRVYDAANKRFLEKGDDRYPVYLHINLSINEIQRIARYLANSRIDSDLENTCISKQMNGLKKLVWIMRLLPSKIRAKFVERMRPKIADGIPNTISEEEKKEMIDDILKMYSNPKAIKSYISEDVFKSDFRKWSNISYQTERVTAAFKNNSINIETFIDTPMLELTKFKAEDLRTVANSNSLIELKGLKYRVSDGKKRYIWYPTRKGLQIVRDAPGLEIIQTYTLVAAE